MLNRKNSAHKYYLKNRLKILKKKKVYNVLNAEPISKQRRQYYLKNKALFKKLHQEYRKKYLKVLQAYQKFYDTTHKKEKQFYNKEYYQKNKKEINDKKNKYYIKRRKQDIDFKLRCNLRIRIWDALKNNIKAMNTLKLIGCPIKVLKQHLQQQFKPGMNWKNYGKWHVDHIKPCARFDLSKPSEQVKCFHYSNLQPLWAKDNFLKGVKYDKL